MNEKSAFIRQIQFMDKCSQMPTVQPWNGKVATPDIFICALGFEDRTTAIAGELQSLLNGQANAQTRGIVCTYSTINSDNHLHSEELHAKLKSFCETVEETPADSAQAIRKTIHDALADWSEDRKCRIVFDISVASGSLILSAFKALIELRHKVEVTVAYCEPQVYFPEKSSFDASPEALVEAACSAGDDSSMGENGVTDVEVNELYPGHNVESRTERVIAVPAFRTSRLTRCLMHISDQILSSPSESIFWVISEPPASELKWRRNFQERIVNVQLAKFVGMTPTDQLAPRLTPGNHEVCSTRAYTDILALIMAQADAHAGSNLSLVHMGSKLQSVGVALALAVRSEITVYSSRPAQFNPSRYSSGIGTKWFLDLSDLDNYIKDLAEVGTLTLQPKIETSRDLRPAY